MSIILRIRRKSDEDRLFNAKETPAQLSVSSKTLTKQVAAGLAVIKKKATIIPLVTKAKAEPFYAARLDPGIKETLRSMLIQLAREQAYKDHLDWAYGVKG